MLVRKALIALGMLAASMVAYAAAGSVSLQFQVINNFPVKYVVVNLRDPEVVVTTAVSASFPYGLESWGSFLNRLRPDAAINGTYFCPHSCQPVGDIAVNGNLLYRGSVGTALCISPDNRAVMLPGPRQAPSNWMGYRTVLCAGPRLLTDGKMTIQARAEGFRDPRVLGSAPRSAICICGDGSMIFLTIQEDISLMNLTGVCQKLGAVQAMALDGGSSSGLYADGRTVTHPSRSISNIIAVYATPLHYASAAGELANSNATVQAHYLPQPTRPAHFDPFYAASPPAPDTAPAQPAATAAIPLIQFLEPKVADVLKGTVTVTVRIAPDARISWSSLRINGTLRAMSNVGALQYSWDSTKDTDGPQTLEVSVWSHDRDLLALESRQVFVHNTGRVAAK